MLNQVQHDNNGLQDVRDKFSHFVCKNLIPNLQKFQDKRVLVLRNWRLEFIWDLLFETWDLKPVRIIGGTSKGRKLATPRGYSLRPTSDRMKESIFSILGKEVEDKVVLDLFAGTGTL